MNTFENLIADLDRLLARYKAAKTEGAIERWDETLDGIIEDGMRAYEANRLGGVKGFEERQASFRTLIESLHADGRVRFADPHGVATGKLSSPVSVSRAQEARRAFAYLATLSPVEAKATQDDIQVVDSLKVREATNIQSDATLDRRVADGTLGAFKLGPERTGHDPRPRHFVLINGVAANAEQIKPHVPEGSTWVKPSATSRNKALPPSQPS